MTSFLDRYRDGEHEAVWRDLCGLGDRVLKQPWRGDAEAVARETMRRVRRNIEMLAERLQDIGFAFADPDAAFVAATGEQSEALAAFEREVGPVPLSVRAFVDEVGTVNFMGNHPDLASCEANDNPLAGLMMVGGPGAAGQFEIGDLLKEMSSSDAIPDHVKKGFSSFFGSFAGQVAVAAAPDPRAMAAAAAGEPAADPLVVDFFDLSVEAFQEQQAEGEGPFRVTFAPDILHKAGVSGGDGYEIILPHAGMDAPVGNTEWRPFSFVEYLRFSLAWAGFPGLHEQADRDEALLASLRAGLLPI